MVFGLSGVVDLLEVQVCPLLYYPVSDPNIWFHRTVGVFLLDEVDTNHAWPLVGACLVEAVEVALLGVELEAEEDKACAELRVLLFDLKVDLVEGLHEHALFVLLDEVALGVVFDQFDQQGSKLDSVVAIPDILQQYMPGVLFEDVQREDQHEEVAYLLLEQHPKVMLHSRYNLQLLLLQHGYVGHVVHQRPQVCELLSQRGKTNPSLLLGLLLGSYLKMLLLVVEVDIGVSDDVFFVLNTHSLTKSSSSAQSKCRWCSTPLGISFSMS